LQLHRQAPALIEAGSFLHAHRAGLGRAPLSMRCGRLVNPSLLIYERPTKMQVLSLGELKRWHTRMCGAEVRCRELRKLIHMHFSSQVLYR
jgi:hypothetical protein